MTSVLPVAAQDVLDATGFHKTKIGAGDKENGYEIRQSSLGKVVSTVGLIVLALSGLFVWSLFEISLTRRSTKIELRHVEHHAAEKLAKAKMELWSHYKDDIHESQHAQSLLKAIQQTHSEFETKLRNTVDEASKTLGISVDQATHLADKILGEVLDEHEKELSLTRTLFDDIIKVGKEMKGEEVKVSSEIKQEMSHESKHIEDEEQEKEFDEEDPDGPGPEEEDDSHDIGMGIIIDAVFDAYHEFETQMASAITSLKEDTQLYRDLQLLKTELEENPPPDRREAVQKLNLASAGIEYKDGSYGYGLDPENFVELLVTIPHMPHEEFKKLEEEWRAGKHKDTFIVLTKFQEWETENNIPSYWLADALEKDEADREYPRRRRTRPGQYPQEEEEDEDEPGKDPDEAERE